MKVILAGPAKRDLAEIGDYIARDDMLRAESFVGELIASCDGLSQLARGYALVPRAERLGVRKRRHGRYLIFYRIRADGKALDILHVVHGARDYMKLLLPDG